MKKLSKFFAIIAGAAMLVSGMVAFSHTRNEVKMEAAKAEAVNATFSNIYNDDWNNTAAGAAGFNKLLIVYEGPKQTSSDPIVGSALDAYANLVTLNGQPFTSATGQHNQLAPWAGQTWFQIIYNASLVSAGSILTIEEGCQIGEAVVEKMSFKLNENNKWDYYFNEPVNATYTGIYNDDWNNVLVAEGYNKLLIKYSGPAHAHDAVINEAELLKYNGYITIGGQSLSALGGLTQIAPFSGQTWIQFIYPATAVTVGAYFIVNDGCKIGNAVLGGFTLKLNSNSKWETIEYIKNESLVKDNDYTLFTISDYPFAVNDAGGFIFYSSQENIAAMSGSFGFRFKVNLPAGQAASTSASLKFAGTDIFGSGALIKININYASNTYLTFNNEVDYCYASRPNPVWTEGVDHVVDVYFIKVSTTEAYVLFGVDGLLIWKSGAKDTTGLTFRNFFTTSGTANTATYYSSDSSVVEEGVERFNKRALHSEDISTSTVTDTGACKGENGYYAKAKSYYGAYLTNAQKALFAGADKYGWARARFAAWGAANDEDVTYNVNGAVFSLSEMLQPSTAEEEKGYIVVIIASVISVLSLSFYFAIRKRRRLKA